MWRNTAATPRLGPFQAGSLAPISVWLLHISKPTFYVAMVGIGFFWILERRGWTPIVLFRWLRCQFAGPFRPAVRRSVWRNRTGGYSG